MGDNTRHGESKSPDQRRDSEGPNTACRKEPETIAPSSSQSHKRHKSLDVSSLSNPSDIEYKAAAAAAATTEESGSSTLNSTAQNIKQDIKVSPIHDALKSGASSSYVNRNPAPPSNVGKSERPENADVKDSLDQLLGISLDSWPYSERILSSTISLRTEMERTRREELRLAIINQTIEFLKLAVQNNIPPQLIQTVFSESELKEARNSAANFKDSDLKQGARPTPKPSTSTSVFKVNIPQPQQFQFHHWQKPDGSLVRSDVSSTGSTVGSSQAAPTTPTQMTDERKRKISDEDTGRSTGPQQESYSIPSHRRNQSEANVSQLRSIYESQISQQKNQHRVNDSQYSLRSPYVYPPRERQMQPAISTPQQHQQQQQLQHQIGQHQRQPQPQPQPQPSQLQQLPQHPHFRQNYYPYPQPPQPGSPGTPIVFSGGIHQIPTPTPPQQQQQPQQPQRQHPSQLSPQRGPQGYQFPQKHPHPEVQRQTPNIILQPPQRISEGSQGSPISGSNKPKGKSDVSFLISTPNNPPK